jgi:hypothetical protein
MSRDSKKSDNETNLSRRNWAIGTEQDRDYWESKYKEAKSFMDSRQSFPSTLIEVAAQHPLVDGEYPNEEFEKRLLLSRQLYDQERANGNEVEIYVPGSVHMFNGKTDSISLSEAGSRFLQRISIPKEIIRGEDLNERFKGLEGVYNSADECFVTASYFKNKTFGHLFSVISPVQLFRKTLHYIEFGVLPLNFTAPSYDTFHSYIGEIFEAIPYVLFVDHNLQGKDSVRSKELRDTRKPSM